MDGVKPYSVEWITPVFSYRTVEYVARIRIPPRTHLYRRQRRGVAGDQHCIAVGHVAGQGLDTVCAVWGWSRLHSLVLVRQIPVPDVKRKSALCSAGKCNTNDRFIRLRVCT